MPDVYFLTVGIILAAIGVGCLAVQLRHRMSCSAKAAAVVVSVRKKKSGYWRGKTFYLYFPAFSYSVQGKEHTVQCRYSVRKAKHYRKGDPVILRYNPSAPENIYTGGAYFSYIAGFLLSVSGAFLIACFFA